MLRRRGNFYWGQYTIFSRVQSFAGLLIVAAAFAIVAVCGFLPASGLRSQDPAPADFNTFYAAGQCYRQGLDPGDFDSYSKLYEQYEGRPADAPWFYPPQAAPFVLLLALFPPRAAMLLLALANLAAALALAWLTLRWVTQARPLRPVSHWPLTLWLLPAVALATPAVTHWIKSGQVTLLAAALIFAGWLAARSRRDLLAGLLFGLAAFKPQFVVLTLLWFLLERRWLLLVATLAVTAALSIPSSLQLGFCHGLTAFLGNLHLHGRQPLNQLGNGLVMGLPSLLAAVGLPMPSPLALLAAAALLVVGLWTMRRHLSPDSLPGLVLGVQLIFAYGKYADMVLLLPLAAGLWLLAGHRRSSWPWLLAGTLLAWTPTRVFIAAGHPEWQHIKMIAFVAGLVALFALALRPESPKIKDLSSTS